jgi:Tol biopolymer transport system component
MQLTKAISVAFIFTFIHAVLYGQRVKPFAPELFSTYFSAGICGFSPKGQQIYFSRQQSADGKTFLYEAQKKGEKWVEEKLLPFSGKYNDVGGRISNDGKAFYFTSDRPGGSANPKDEWNIWVSRNENEQWMEPIPLNHINNKGMECCPVPLDNGQLLFSSDRGKPHDWWIFSLDLKSKTEIIPDSLNKQGSWQWPSSTANQGSILLLNSMKRPDSRGMDDIYVSFRNTKEWSEPVNIGEPVNTASYEEGAILSADKRWLIFCRRQTPTAVLKVFRIKWKPLLQKLKKAHNLNGKTGN